MFLKSNLESWNLETMTYGIWDAIFSTLEELQLQDVICNATESEILSIGDDMLRSTI